MKRPESDDGLDDLEGAATGTAPRAQKSPSSPSTPAPGSAPAVAGDLPAGTQIAGRYRIAGLIGEGGMGRVFRADDLLLGIQVALKFLPDSLKDDPERRSRVIRMCAQGSLSRILLVTGRSHFFYRPYLTIF
ncbi:MAG: hypothetical protein JJE39_11690 [Vicinamibacteria bacterium]|nr:hypothetical protein [Vicinamibacteria bacterium]